MATAKCSQIFSRITEIKSIVFNFFLIMGLTLKQKIKSFYKIYKRNRFKLKFLTPKPKMPFEVAFVIGSGKTGTISMYHFLKSIGLRHLTINNIVKAK